MEKLARAAMQLLKKALQLKANVHQAWSGKLARNSAWMLAGQGFSVALQAGYFVVLARLLGSKSYGIYVGAVALVSLISQYSGNGSGTLFLRYVSIARDAAPRYFGNILLSIAATGCLLVVILSSLAPHLISPDSAAIVATVAIGDCICKQLNESMAGVFQAYEQMRITAVLTSLTSASRLVVAGTLLLAYGHVTAAQWAYAALGISAASCALALFIVIEKIGKPQFVPSLLVSHFREGFGFSFAASTFSAYNDIDKSMLSHYGMITANGLYTMAYRIVDIATMPMWSVVAAAQPRLFKLGKGGVSATMPLARRTLAVGVVSGTLLAIGMFLGAPVLPLIIGRSFAPSVDAVRWLCLLPLMRACQLSAGGALTGAGLQRYRTIAQLIAACFNFAINLYLIPKFGWIGAAWSSLFTDGGVAILNWSTLTLFHVKELKQASLDEFVAAAR